MVRIITDSTSDLGREFAGTFDIEIIPLYVYAREQTYIDGINISLADLYASVDETGQLPKTSAPTIGDFIKVFSGPEEIVYLSISSKLSATYQNALLAKELLPEQTIYLIDSLNLSTGIGQLAIKAAALRDKGLCAAEIAAAIEAMIPNSRTSFVVETLDYLFKGGRCSALQNVMGSLLQIRPTIAVRPDGTLGVKSKTRGTRAKALHQLVDDFTSNLALIDLERVFITHSGCEDDAQALCIEINEVAPIKNTHITYAGSVIASHCGPDTIGLVYLLK